MSFIEEFKEIGFSSREVRENMLAITTPQTFNSGDPVSFYIRKNHQDLIFEDYGINLNSLKLSIPNPKRASHIIRSQLSKFHNDIEFDGYNLTRVAKADEKIQAMAELMDLFGLLTNFQPKTTHEQNRILILDEICTYLKKKYREITPDIEIKGRSGTQYEFDFLADSTLVDFVPAHNNATGAVLRKIHDVKLVYKEYDYRIIIDDTNAKKSQKEAKILSSVATVIPFSMVEKIAA